MTPPANRHFLQLLGVFVVIVLLWNTTALAPLKLLVVFFHEISHGIAAVLTGGSIVSLQIMSNEGGLATTAGGSRFVVVSAGYMGSFFWGAALILGAARLKRDRLITALLAAMLAVVTLLYVRNLFGFVFGLATAASLFAAARFLGDQANDFLLKLVGMTSCGYAILDIWSDLISRSVSNSDASQLAAMTFIPAVVWGFLWLAFTVIGMFVIMRILSRLDRQ